MGKLLTQFEQAKTNVEPDGVDKANAAEAHKAVRAVLEADPGLVTAGIEDNTILIGSYKRHVSIKRVKDVDVLSKLPGLDADHDPQDLLDDIETVLVDEFGRDRVKRQDRSIKVLFPDYDLHVDAVPARPAGIYWEIPDRTSNEGTGWQQTNPEELTTLTIEMNGRYDDEYVPLVKLIRQARRTNLGKYPGGLYFEILTYHAFDSALDDACPATLFVAALRSIATQLADVVSGGDVADPTIPGSTISVRCTDAEMANAAGVIADLATKAEAALADTDDCTAAKTFRDILGKNADDEWVFPMPAVCNDDGTRRSVNAIIAGDKHVPAGDGRFA